MDDPNAPQPPPEQYNAEQVRNIVADAVQRAITAFAQGVEQQELAARIPHLIPPPPPLIQAPDLGKSFVPKPKDYDGEKTKFHSWWRSVTLYLGGFREAPNDQQKIMMVLSFMTEKSAARFADTFLENHSTRLDRYAWVEFARNVSMMFAPSSLRRNAEQKLLTMKQQDREQTEEFLVRFQQAIAEAQINTVLQGRFLINLLRSAAKNSDVEFVERSKSNLIESDNFDDWVQAIAWASRINEEIEARKKTARPAPSTSSSTQRFYVSPNYRGTNPRPFQPRAPPTPSNPTPNAAGVFPGQGAPMDISKARAEGKCFRCGKAWPCQEHFRPRASPQKTMTFRNRQIMYTSNDDLAAKIAEIEKEREKEKGFPTGGQ